MKGVVWQWNALLQGEPATGGLSAVPNPHDYLLTLDEDGSFEAKADCNSLRGTYSISGSDLTLELGPTTKAACGEGSRSDVYIRLLGKVATYEIYEEGHVALGLENDTGYMYFSAA